MGDLRFERPLGSVKHAADPGAAIRSLSDVDVIAALAAASRDQEPYLANILATEALNRVRRMRAISDHLGEGVFAVDTRGRVTFLNAAAENVLGWRHSELAGAPMGAIMPTPALVEAVLENGGTQRCDVAQIVRKDGRVLSASVTISAISEPGSNAPREIEGAIIVFQDVSNRIEAEMRMRERARRLTQQNQALGRLASERNDAFDEAMNIVKETLAATLEVDRVGVWLYDADTRSLTCHDFHERNSDAPSHPPLLSMTAAESSRFLASLRNDRLINASMACFDPHIEGLSASYLAPNNICSMLAAAVYVGGEWRGALIVEQVDASRHWHEDEQRFIGSVASFAASVMEARERRRAERALQERETFHEALMSATDQAGIGVVVYAETDGVPRLRYANEAARALLGPESDTWMEHPWESVIPPADAKRLRRWREQAKEGHPAPGTFSTVILRADGTRIPVQVGVRQAVFNGEPAMISAFRTLESIPVLGEEAK